MELNIYRCFCWRHWVFQLFAALGRSIGFVRILAGLDGGLLFRLQLRMRLYSGCSGRRQSTYLFLIFLAPLVFGLYSLGAQ